MLLYFDNIGLYVYDIDYREYFLLERIGLD